MAGRSFTRHNNGVGNRIQAEHINELQVALEEDDARIDLKTDDGQFTAHVDNTDNPHNVTKAQVGLGNVDNTSDADKPVSTAQQAALDGKADVEDAVPDGGVYGQVLTVTHSGREWVDPPGIVYPSLLLSPDGSFDRDGAVVPTVDGDVSVVAGRYGQAWKIGSTGTPGVVFSPLTSRLSPQKGSVVARFQIDDTTISANYAVIIGDLGVSSSTVSSFAIWTNNVTGWMYIRQDNNDRMIFAAPFTPGAPLTVYLGWDDVFVYGSFNGAAVQRATRFSAGSTQWLSDWTSLGNRRLSNNRIATAVRSESTIYYPDLLPASEVVRISNLPAAWTPANTAVNMALQSQPPAGSPFLQMHPPNRKIGTGGATLRTAPGPSTQAITTLAAGTDVHDTKQTVSVSSVSYSLVVTAFGNAWVPSSTLV